MIPALIEAGGLLGGALIASRSQKKQTNTDLDFQREVYKNQIQWKVNDALKAGVNPLYAFGSPAYTPSSSVGSTTDFASVGAGLGRAASGYAERKMLAAQAEQQSVMFNLDKEEKRARINLLQAQAKDFAASSAVNSAKAVNETLSTTRRLPLGYEEQKAQVPEYLSLATPFGDLKVNRDMASAQSFEDRYGDIGAALYGIPLFFHDLDKSIYDNYFRPYARKRAVMEHVKDNSTRKSEWRVDSPRSDRFIPYERR